MAEHLINFVEGNGISIQAPLSVPDADAYDVEIATTILPPGGTTGQVLAKTSGDDYDTEWATAAGSSSTVWVPLIDRPDGTAVLDTDGNLILTLIPVP